MTRIEAIAAFLEKCRIELINDQAKKGIRAGGRSANSLHNVTEPAGGKVLGEGYFHFQKVGRRPGTFPSIEAILTWIRTKGIPSDIPETSLAFLIARKIFRKGTDIYMKKRPALSIEAKMVEFRKEFMSDLGKLTAQELLAKFKAISQP